jgi:hypothetical protein
MILRAKIILDFTGYWLSGTGAARGRDVDAVTHRDRQKLPAMPMTQVKGQLRETARRLAAAGAGGWTDGRVTYFFGADSVGRDPADVTAAALGFHGEARIPGDDVRAWLAHTDNTAVRERLFARLPATAIDRLGAARDHSLRSVEAAVPLTVEGVVEWVGTDPPDAGWVEALDLACAATIAFGKLKGDGYGRALAQAVPA